MTHEFTLTVTDSLGETNTDTVTVTVTPSARPVANAGPDQTVISEAPVTLDGRASTAASGRTIASYFWERTSGSGGSVTLSSTSEVQPTFMADTLSSGAAGVTHEFTLTVTDSLGETNTDTVTVTVTPSVRPVANAGSDQTVISEAPVTLDGKASTAASGRTIASYFWERTSGRGGFVPVSSTSVVYFLADTLASGAADVTHEFMLTVTDSLGETNTDTVTVTVTPSARPVANAGPDQTVISEAPVTLDGRASTAASGRTIASYFWERTSGSGGSVTLSSTSEVQPTFMADTLSSGAAGVTHEFTLTVTDSLGETNTDTVTVTVTPSARPVANAGPDQTVISEAPVTLDGRASTAASGRTIASYFWERTSGSGGSVTLSSTSEVQPTFMADTLSSGAAGVTHEFTLTVTDSLGETNTDTVTVTVTPSVRPVANAGSDQTVISEAPVTLDGKASTAASGRTIASYFWERTSGRGGFVPVSSTSVVYFLADTLASGAADVTHEFMLTVTDSLGETNTDTVTVTVTPSARPVANAGPDQTVISEAPVTLDGRASTAASGRTIASYFWERTSGSGGSVTLSSTSEVQPTFMADTLSSGAAGVTHEFTLTVTDSLGETNTDTVTVTVTPSARPVANAGPDQTVISEAPVTLDGRASTAASGRTIASYFWERTSGSGGSVTLSSTSEVQPTFMADTLSSGAAGVTHEFTLTVTDSLGETNTDTVTVTVTPSVRPVANAGSDQTVISEAPVTLDGKASTAASGRTIASYFWERTSGSGGFVPVSSTSVVYFLADTLASGAADVTHEFMLTVTDSLGETNTDTVTVTVTPSARPVANAGPDQTVISEAPVTLDGRASTAASGRTIASYFWERTSGSGGSVTLSSTSEVQPTFMADTLSSGAAGVTHEFTLTVTDSLGETNTDTVTVTVTPSARPVANAGPDQTVISEAPVTLDGRASTAASGRTIASYFWERTSGSGGSVTLSSTSEVQPTFMADTLSSGAAGVTHEFTLTVTDSLGETNTDTVTVTVTPSVRPVANAGSDQTVISEAPVTLDGKASTAASGRTIASYFWERTSGRGGFVPVSSTSVVYFLADTLASGAADVTHEFMLTVTDSLGETNTDTVTVTVTPSARPVANAGPDQTVISEAPVTLDGRASTAASGRTIASYFWERTSGSGGSVTLSSTSEVQPTFMADTLSSGAAGVTHEFTLTVTDSLGETNTDTVTVTVTPSARPVANAGPDQTVISEAPVTLDGRASTAASGRTIASYFWERTSGSGGSVTLSSTSEVQPTFMADTLSSGAAGVTHEFTLTVTDSLGETNTDTVTVTVTPSVRPVANAGSDQTVISEAPVTLDGKASTAASGRTIASYFWERTSGSGGFVPVSSTSVVYFLADTLASGAADVTHEFMLTVTDSLGETNTDTVTVTVTPSARPVANAGPDQTVISEAPVTLDGRASTAASGRTIASYFWERTSGSGGSVTLSSTSEVQPTFMADTLSSGAAGVTHEFTLTVTDSLGETNTDTVTVTVTPSARPVANAGPDQTVISEAPVTLDGRASTAASGRTIASYFWERTSGSGGSVTLSSTSEVQPTFMADTLSSGAAGVTHEFTLTVTDSLGETNTDTVTVTVTAPNIAPVANAGSDQTVQSGGRVILDGSGSLDNDGTIEHYSWRLISGGSSSHDYTNGGSGYSTIRSDIPVETVSPGAADVTLVFELTVTDDDGATSTDTVTITVESPNLPPVANATVTGLDPFDERFRLIDDVGSGATVQLDGSRSWDPDGTIASYLWTRTGGTGDSGVTLIGAHTAKPRFTADTLAPGTVVNHVFELVVTDDEGAQTADTVTVYVTANAVPIPDAGPNQTVASGATVQLDGSRSWDPDGTVVDYTWTWTSADPGPWPEINDIVFNADNSVMSFTAPTLAPDAEDVTYVFWLSVSDNSYYDSSWPDSVMVTVTQNGPFPGRPIADAGPSQTVATGATVHLDGSRSWDRDGTIASYLWTHTSCWFVCGDVTLIGADTANPRFTADTLATDADEVYYIFSLVVTNDDGVSSEVDQVEIRVLPKLAPVAKAGPDQTVASDAKVTLDGSGSSHEDGFIVSYLWTRTGGSGDSTVALNGVNTAQLTFAADTMDLGAADVTHVFSLVVTDLYGVRSEADEVTITVESLIKAVAEAGDDQEVASGDTVRLDGRRSTGDSRATLSYAWERTGGTTGGSVDLTAANTATPTFTADMLAPGAADVTHIFTLRVTDNKGSAAATATVTITVISPFAAPVVEAGDDQEVASGDTVWLDGRGSTVDRRRTLVYHWIRTGGTQDKTVALTSVAPAQATFTADTLSSGAADVTHVFTLSVADISNISRISLWSDMVTVTVVAPFADPVADAGDDQLEVNPGDTVRLDGRGSTSDRRATLSSYAWVRTGGTQDKTVALTGAATAQPTFTADILSSGAADVTHEFTLTVTDSLRKTNTDTVTVTVTAPNIAPVANAGSDQTVQSGGRVILDGSGSLDNDGTIEHYSWRLISGGSSSHDYTNGGSGIYGREREFPVETVSPDTGDVTLVFELTVTDDDGTTSTDTVTVTVKPDTMGPIGVFKHPVSHDGTTPFTITIVFDEEARFIGNHLWHQLTNLQASGVQLIGPLRSNGRKDPNDRRRYTFTVTPRSPGDIRIGLRSGYLDTFGNRGGTFSAEIPYVVPNEPPVADAGSDQTVQSGGRVPLDGSGSLDNDGTIEHYSWRLISGGSSSHDYTNGGSGYSTIRSDIPVETVSPVAADVTLVFELTVTDDDGATSTDTVTITVKSPNAAPIAYAGTNQTVASGARVTLDGRGSGDIDGDIVSYLWTRTGGSGDSGATLTNATTTQPSFAADTVATGTQDVTHVFSLVVTDDEGAISTADEVTITIEAPNLAPVADAGPQFPRFVSGTVNTLDGSGSYDQDGTIVSYRWERINGSGDSPDLNGANTAQLTFTADTLVPNSQHTVFHVFSLVVTDNDGAQSIADTVTVVVVNEQPIADAGPNQTVASGATVQLDGSRSWDPDGTIGDYTWSNRGYETITINNGEAVHASFTAPIVAPGSPDVTVIIQLLVIDNSFGWSADTMTVTVTARPIPVRPVADAGPNQTVASGATVRLNGNRSRDSDGTIASYRWTRTGGTLGRNVALIGADTAQPSFTDTLETGAADVTHIFALTVTDDTGVASIEDTVTVMILANNAHPIADTGLYQTVSSGATVQLDGSGSWDSDGTISRYHWTSFDVTLTDADTAMPSFTAVTLELGAADVTHIIHLQVADNGGKRSHWESVRVTVTAPNIAPVAVAGDDQEVASGETVYLDASGSSDQGGTIEKYLWERVGGTSSRKNVFEPLDELPTNSVRGEEPGVSFTADTLSSGAADVTHVFNLWVADNDGAWSVADQVTVTITPETTALASYADPGTDRLSADGNVDILVSPSELTVQEGGPGSYRVKLSEFPGQDVIVTAASSNEDVVLENPHLSFNADNWNEWQQVTLRAVADSDNTNDVAQIRHNIDANAVTVGRPGVVSITVRDEDIILRPIGEYLETRATTLLRNQPKLISFLKLSGTPPDGNNTLSLNATDGNLQLDGEFVRDGMWGAITGSYASNSSGELNYALGSFGIHWKSSEHLLAGAMLQFDLADGDLGGRAGSIDGKGWLAGPYFAARHVTQPLFFEGRMLYGQSNQDFKFNDDVFEERNGSFSTTRWLAQLRMEGEIALSTPWSDGSRLIPYADARWIEDRAAAFTDSIGIRVPGQKVSIGEFELGSNIEVPISMTHGSMTFTGGLGVVFSNADGDYIRSESRSRGRGEVGLSYSLDDNVQIDFEGYFDGFGTSQYESYGLSLSAVMKF